jgi:hypothetical protein
MQIRLVIQPPFWTPPRRKRYQSKRWPHAAKHWYRRRRAFRSTGEAMPTIIQVPPPWSVIRLAARMGTPYEDGYVSAGRWIGAWLNWICSRPAAILHQSAVVRFSVKMAAAAAVLVALITFMMDLQNLEEDRVNRAWSLIATAKEVEGNVGLIEALETLHARKIALESLQAPRAYLRNIKLVGVNLIKADLRGANLDDANLSGAQLWRANLSGADLNRTNLSRADLSEANLHNADLLVADLSGANLSVANLSGANLEATKLDGVYLIIADLSGANLSRADLSKAHLRGANLSEADLSGTKLGGADLSGAHNLSQQQLDQACGDEHTRLPVGTTIAACEPGSPIKD